MRIVHVITNLGIGGAEQWLVQLITFWPSLDDQHTVLTLRGGLLHEAIAQCGAQINCLQDMLPRLTKFQRIKYIFHILQSHDAIIVSLLTTNVFVRLVNIFLRKKVVSVLHNTFEYLTLKQKIAEWFSLLLGRCQLVAVAPSVAISYQNIFLGSWLCKNMIIIENGVGVPSEILANEPDERLQHITDKKMIVGVVGRLVPVKRYDFLLHAFALFLQKIPENQRSAACLVIAGDGPERKKLEQLADQLRLTDNVVFLGMVRNLAPWYKKFSCYITCSHTEGLSMALLEAFAAGCQVITTSAALVPPDIAQDAYAVCAFDTPTSLADRLLQLYEQKMVLHPRLPQKYTSNFMANRYKDLLICCVARFANHY